MQIEEFHRYDCYAVAIVNEKTVGHVPRKILKLFYYFKGNGTICGEVTGKRQRSAIEGKLRFEGPLQV